MAHLPYIHLTRDPVQTRFTFYGMSTLGGLQEMLRRLMTTDEVRRTPDTILFVRNYRPVRLSKIGYHEIKPWSKWVGINPLFGKPFKGKTRLRL